MKHPKSYDSTPETRKRMSKVKLKGGKAESILAKALWQKGYRYRRNDKRLPGSPDIAVLKYQVAIFVDGEFWHGYDWENRKQKLKSNREYWIEKIEENIARDIRNDGLLKEQGWIPIHFWEKQITHDLQKCVDKVVDKIQIVYAQNVEL